jgi:trk system potassium uptake protein TrkH
MIVMVDLQLHHHPLGQPVRGRVLARYLGQVAVALGVLTLVPLGVALATGETAFGLRLALCVLLPAGLFGLGARIDAPQSIQANEALAVTALAFVLAPLLFTWPFALYTPHLVDALFEAVSGVTTTGLSTLASVEGLPPAFHFARAWTQWFGGLGIVVLTLALLSHPGGSARRLAELAGHEDDLVGSTRVHARRIFGIYLTLSVAGISVLIALGAAPFDAVVHTLAAVSTGGFSSHDASLDAFAQPRLQLAILLLALCGALPLHLYHLAWKHGWRALGDDLEVRALLAATLLCALLLGWLGHLDGWQAGLLALSAQSTTGFAPTDVAALPDAGKWVLLGSMFTGAGIGSTGGGIKLLRLLILLRLLQLLLLRLQLPGHAVVTPRLGGQALGPAQVEHALLLILLFAGVTVVSWGAFLAAGLPPLDALFDVVSATGTVGLSTGVVGPGLAPGLKLLLCADMLLGRVEVVALLLLLYPATWR